MLKINLIDNIMGDIGGNEQVLDPVSIYIQIIGSGENEKFCGN